MPKKSPTDAELDAFGRRFDRIHDDAKALFDRYEGLLDGVPPDEVPVLLDAWSNLWDRLLETVGAVFAACSTAADAVRAQRRGLFDAKIVPCAEILAGESDRGLFSLRMGFRTAGPMPTTPRPSASLAQYAPEVRELLKQPTPAPAPEPAPTKSRKRGTR